MLPSYNPTALTAPLGAQGANTNTDNLPFGISDFFSKINPAQIDNSPIGGTTPTQQDNSPFSIRDFFSKINPTQIDNSPIGGPIPAGEEYQQQQLSGSGLGNLGGEGLGALGGGQQNLNLGQVGLTFNPSGQGRSQNKGYTGWQFAKGGSVNAQGIASLGRGPDSMLMHVTPGEVQGLQQLAMAHGGSLTINPQTGLPEAGFLSSILPALAGAAANVMLPGSGMFVGAALGGMMNKESPILGALSGGLGGYGSGEITSAIGGLGSENLAQEALMQQAAQNAALEGTTLPSNYAQLFKATTDPKNYADLIKANIPDVTSFDKFSAGMKGFMPGGNSSFSDLIGKAASKGVEATGLGGLGGAAKTVGMVAAPLLPSALKQNTLNVSNNPAVNYPNYKYSPPKFNTVTGQYDIPGSYQTISMDEGGPVEGVNPQDYGPKGKASESAKSIYRDDKQERPLKNVSNNTLAALEKGATSSKVMADAIAEKSTRLEEANANPAYYDVAAAAGGGLMGLSGEYAAGGRLLQGPGDGMSDSIPAVINGPKPQRAALAQGEFVIPADVVSHLGNGSTDAGAKRLYAMMDKIRHARTGNKKQGRQINPDKFMPA